MVKDPTSYSLLTYAWIILLSTAGGALNFIRKARSGEVKHFDFVLFFVEVLASGLVGIITFWLCEHSNIDPLLTAALVGISGHMGSRTLYIFENKALYLLDRWLGIKPQDPNL